jgi:PAS domain S-box-containing protein
MQFSAPVSDTENPPALLQLQDALEALDLVSDGCLLIDSEMRVRYINRTAERLLHAERDDLIGRPVRDVCPMLRATPLESLCTRPIQSLDTIQTFETLTESQTGRLYDVHARPSSSGVLITFRDITEHRDREDALQSALASEQVARISAESAEQENRRRLETDRFLAEASRVLSSSLDFETTLRSVARLAVPRLADWCVVHIQDPKAGLRQLVVQHQDPKLIRWARELERRYPADLDSPHGIGRVFKTGDPLIYPTVTDEMLVLMARDPRHLEMLRKVGFTSAMVVPLVSRDRVLGVISFISAEQGYHYSEADLRLAERLAHRAALAMDNSILYRAAQQEIAERARAEDALRETEIRYRTLTNAVSQLIWQNDARGKPVYFNEQWEQYVGVERLADSPIPWTQFVHPDDLPHVLEARSEGLQTGEAYESRCRLLRHDGIWRWHIARVVPMTGDDGNVESWIGAATDIHEMQVLMEQLTVRQMEVEELNEQLSRAMTETHHRVKNNLQIMAAMIDMQVMDADTTVPVNELRRLNRHIRTLAVIHDLLTQKAREDGRAEQLSARAILLQLLPMLQQTAGPQAIDFSADDVPLGSRQGTSLALVTNELVSNALKYGRNRIRVRLSVSNTEAALEVCDDGPGFPADFDPGAQSNTGLELVENLSRWDLDGHAVYTNAPDGGACVRVVFPVGR